MNNIICFEIIKNNSDGPRKNLNISKNKGFFSYVTRDKEGILLNEMCLNREWKQYKLHYGRLFYDKNKTKIKYIGYFNKNNKFEGEGEFFLNNENNTRYYKGYHKNGLPNGNGTIYYENGNKHYIGSIKNGYFHGEGLEYYEDEKLMYNGTFKIGDKNGKGIFFLKIVN